MGEDDDRTDTSEAAQPVRSQQTVEFLRVVQQHHIQLSSMADFKANILMAACVLLVSFNLRAFGDGLPPPAMLILLGGAVAAAVCALLAVMPATARRAGQAPNRLFFGGFAEMEEADYQAWMRGLLDDRVRLEEAMVRDIHQLGLVLARKKYLWLGRAYRLFLAGILGAALVWAVDLLI
ncbi:MAG: Pycsar system effector family protein [Thermaurantiacus sp.]